MNDELVKRINNLQRQVDNLIKPEVPLGISLISETVLSGSVASVTFSSIPQRFRNLLLIAQVRNDAAVEVDNLFMRFNADSGTNYDFQQVYGNSATPVASAARAATSITIGSTEGANSRASLFAGNVCFIPGYSLATLEKTALCITQAFGDLSADADLFALYRSGHWRSTAAITSITLLAGGGNFVAVSRFQLYGIM